MINSTNVNSTHSDVHGTAVWYLEQADPGTIYFKDTHNDTIGLTR